MIWIRRVFAALFGIVFIVLLPVVLLTLRLNDTFLEPQFHTNILRKVDFFNFFYDDALPLLIDENIEQAEGLPFGVTLEGQDVVDAVREVMPPEWLQEQTEHVLGQALPYITGSTDSFQINIQLSDRIRSLSPALKGVLIRSNTYNVLSSQEFVDDIDQQIRDFGDLPFSIDITGQQITSLLQNVLPASWIQEQTEANIDHIVDYLTTDGQDVIVQIPLKDRIQAALGGSDAPVKGFLRDIGAYDRVFQEGVTTLFSDQVLGPDGAALTVPIVQNVQLEITSDDLVTALEQVPPAVLQAQLDGAIDEITPYLTGDAESFKLELSVEDMNNLVTPIIVDLMNRKFRETYESLPTCSTEQVASLVQSGLQSNLPICSPPGFSIEQIQTALGIPGPSLSRGQLEILCSCDLSLALEPLSYDSLVSLLGIDVEMQVGDVISSFFPSSLTFTDTDLRDTLSTDDEETLDRFLGYARNGFVYTDSDLRKDLANVDNGQEGFQIDEETLDRVLDWIRHGFTYTDRDFLDDITDDEGDNQLDQGRRYAGIARSLLPILYVVLAVLLIAIGFLGGRKWSSRIAWPAAFLAIGSAIVYSAIGPAYRSVAEPRIQDEISMATAEENEITMLFTNKASEIATTVAREFLSGIESTALTLLIIGGSALALALLWPRISAALFSRRRR